MPESQSRVPHAVLVTVPRLDLPGGVSNYFRVLRRYLDADKVYFEIGATSKERLGLGSFVRMLEDYWSFHKQLAATRFALVHLNPSFVPKSLVRDMVFVLIARAHRVPVLVFFHGWGFDFQRVIARWFGGLFRAVFGRASAFIVLAEDFRAQLRSMGIRAPIDLLATLVDDSVFAGSRDAALPDAPLSVLYLSRLAVNKGAVEAIEAFAMLRASHPQATLNIAGDGPERAKAEALVRSRGIEGVQFVGHVDGPGKARLFRGAAIYLFPTLLDEGMPTTVIEAMAYGLPVVTRAVGGLKDFFVNGSMGFMTESRDPREFARLIAQLAADPQCRRDIGAFNRDFAREHFAASAIARRLEQVYVSVIR